MEGGTRRRLFVAVWPPPEVIDSLHTLRRPDVAGLRWTAPEQWHVTLRFLGDADVDATRDALRGVRMPTPIEASLGPRTDRFGQRVLHVPVGGLNELATAVIDATAAIGEPPEARPFNAHITLARPRGRARVDLAPLAGDPIEGSWPVRSVDLVSSVLSRGGSRYEVVELYALT